METKCRAWTAVLTALGSALLILGLLIASIEMFAVSPDFYQREYKKLGTAQSIGISEDDLIRVTDKLIRYTTGAEDNLNMQAEIQGQMQEVFGEREKAHMVDVKTLYLGARTVRTVSLALAVVLIAAAFLAGKRMPCARAARSCGCHSGSWRCGAIALTPPLISPRLDVVPPRVFYQRPVAAGPQHRRADPDGARAVLLGPGGAHHRPLCFDIPDAEHRRRRGPYLHPAPWTRGCGGLTMDRLILAIETSCDETAAAVTQGRRVLGSSVYTRRTTRNTAAWCEIACATIS